MIEQPEPDAAADQEKAATGLRSLFEGLPPQEIENAVAHASWVGTRVESYERLAFLGDSVLGLAIAEHLYAEFTDLGAGGLTRIHGQVVSGRSCALVAFAIGLDEALIEREPDATEGRHAASELVTSERVMASICEAAIGACYLEHGLQPVANAVVAAFEPHIVSAVAQPVDFKSALQEELARDGLRVEYAVVETHGPPHDRTFEVEALVDGEALGAGSGQSKKSAEQEAAEQALSARRSAD